MTPSTMMRARTDSFEKICAVNMGRGPMRLAVAAARRHFTLRKRKMVKNWQESARIGKADTSIRGVVSFRGQAPDGAPRNDAVVLSAAESIGFCAVHA